MCYSAVCPKRLPLIISEESKGSALRMRSQASPDVQESDYVLTLAIPPSNALCLSLPHDALHNASCWSPFAGAIVQSCLKVVFAYYCVVVAMAGLLNNIVRQSLVTPRDIHLLSIMQPFYPVKIVALMQAEA